MTFRNRLVASLVISFLLSAQAIVKSQVPKKPPTKSAPTQKKPTMPIVAGTAVFVVQKYEDGVSIDPIVIFNKGQYIDPQPEKNSAVSKQVVEKYMRAGQKHRLIFGGAEAGTITIKEAPTESQIGLTTSATLQSSIKIGGAVMALATTSDTLGAKQNSRRAPTSEERAAMMDLMRATCKQKKVAPAAIAKATVNNITAIDLDGDGKVELIGSFEIKDQTQNSQSLFLIAEIQNSQYQSSLTWYKKGDEGSFEDRSLIDVLDLDGDGIAEVFVAISYYESEGFTIYKKVKGVWRSVYHGGLFGV